MYGGFVSFVSGENSVSLPRFEKIFTPPKSLFTKSIVTPLAPPVSFRSGFILAKSIVLTGPIIARSFPISSVLVKAI